MSIWTPRLAGVQVLDLFAGTGAIGIEAISRGAAFVQFVESHPQVVRQLEQNCELLDPACYQISRLTIPGDLSVLLKGSEAGFDLVFADPPYSFAEFDDLLVSVAGVVSSSGEVVVEHAARNDLPRSIAGLALRDRRRFGDSALSFYRFPVVPEDWRKKASSSR